MHAEPAEIPIGASETCFQVEAVDDEIVESEEVFAVIIAATHPNDMVNGSTTVVINDNDGMLDRNFVRTTTSQKC